MEPNGGFSYEFMTTEPGTGFFFFENVTEGDYYIFASLTPQSQYFYDYFPTYYGNATFWSEATLITLGEPNNPYDINLVPFTNLNSGPGSITGTVAAVGNKAILEENVTVVLMDMLQNVLTSVQTNEQGEFGFDNLEYGYYTLKVEIPGVTSEIAWVELDQNTQAANVSFILEGNTAYLSVSNIHEVISQVSDIYPNPVDQLASMDITTKENLQAELNIYNQMGQLISHREIQLIQGKETIDLDVSDLSQGFYTIQIISNTGRTIVKKFIK